MEVKNVVLM